MTNVLSMTFFKERSRKKERDRLLHRIYEDYYNKIYNFFMYRTGNPSLAEDLSSEVFEKVLVNIESYKSSSPLNPWIFTIARNTLYDYFRLKKDEASLSGWEDSLVDEEDLELNLIKGERNQRLFKALRTLDEREQTIVSYKFGGELKNTEIGKILDLSPSNVGIILHRAMKKLKKELEKND